LDKSKQHIIKSIAQDLDCGFDCFYNIKTDEVVTVPNFKNISDDELFDEAFGDIVQSLESNKADFIKIEVLESFESFKIMERFVGQLSDLELKGVLEDVLKNRKPFQNFKYVIENSACRQSWFDFKQNELERIVEIQLKLNIAGDWQLTDF